ncbi:MAG: RNA polymerase sigma-54 factor, partial [Desulfurobacteriaceae bacterium]
MRQSLEQTEKLSLQLKLNPHILLNLEFLQLPILKLEDVIRKEIEENPLLELDEEARNEKVEEKEEEETIYDFVVEDGNFTFYEPKEDKEISIPFQKSLQEILLEQARLELSSEDLKIARFMIENLDSRGYLLLSEDEISNELKVPLEKIKEVREKIKRFYPVGCACYTLLESFKAQLEELEVPEKFLKALEKIDVLKKGKNIFRKEVNFTQKEMEEFLKVLQRLDPEPGNLGTFNVKLVPDLKVRLVKD